eukprot:RCo004602
MFKSREEREKAFTGATLGLEDRVPTKAIPGYTGHLRSAKDVHGKSLGKLLELDATRTSPVKLRRPTRTAGSTFLSSLDNDGAVWDHEYLTTSKEMNLPLAETVTISTPNIVGFTGHTHLAREVIGAPHEEVIRLAGALTKSAASSQSPTTLGESKPHWTAFATTTRGHKGWQQDYVSTLTQRPNTKKVELTADIMEEQEAARQRKLLEQARLAHQVLPEMSPPSPPGSASVTLAKMSPAKWRSPTAEPEGVLEMGPAPIFLRDNTLNTEAPEDEKEYTGHSSSAQNQPCIVGYTGHLHGGQTVLGLNFGRAVRRCNPHVKVPEEPHPLGSSYRAAAPPGPPISTEVKAVIQRPPRPRASNNPTVDSMRIKIVHRGGRSGFRRLTQALRKRGEATNQRLSRYDFQAALVAFGIHLSQQEMDQLMVIFDHDGSERVSVNEVVHTFRGATSQDRLYLVQQAYSLVEDACERLNGGRPVQVRHLLELHDSAHHPEAMSGEKTAFEVSSEFAATWTGGDERLKAAEVPMEAFVDYYGDISAAIDNDAYFELLVRNVWHLSGGQGPAANTSCLRVPVVFKNGTQAVAEVKNDLGVRRTDKATILKMLTEYQGLSDVARVQL